MKLDRFGPPGYLDDFPEDSAQLAAWSRAMSGWFDEYIADLQGTLGKEGTPQFYNATKVDHGVTIDQVIGWNGFPGTLRNRWGREMALDLADQMVPMTRRIDGPGSYRVGRPWGSLFYRPQDEYCEWRVARDDQGRIISVTFTSEPPEYWQAMHGDSLPDINGEDRKYHFPGDRKLLLDLYRKYVSTEVQMEDLQCPMDLYDETNPNKKKLIYRKGDYNPYNRWNTTGGIMHLTQPANSLSAEIGLGAAATVLYQRDGRRVVDPDALISCAAFGGLNRASDPTIGSTVNELTALGAYITLRDPVGLAMHHMDLAGITAPNGEPIDKSFFRVERGRPEEGQIERAVFEVPKGEGYTVSDLTIGGVPLNYGGQLAERVVVNIVGSAAALGSVTNPLVTPTESAYQDHLQGNWLYYAAPGQPAAPVASAAFTYPEATPADPVRQAGLAGNGAAASAASVQPSPRQLTRSV